MLEVSDLSVSYGQHRALDQVSLTVGKGEIVVILGSNGAGKTTILKALGGICEGRVTGSARIDGSEILGRPADEIVAEGLALVPEGRGIFGDLTVQENLALGAYPTRARDEEAANQDTVFSLFPKLQERRRQVVRTMSGGEQQMVAIGRAMMSNPSILALDEPSLGLSPLLCKELFQSLKSVRQAGLGILLVEQNARQSLAIADRGYLLENGHVTHHDTAAALMVDPAVRRAYLGGPRGAVAPPVSSAKAMTPAFGTPTGAQSPADIAAKAVAQFQTRRAHVQTTTKAAQPARNAPPIPNPPSAAATPSVASPGTQGGGNGAGGGRDGVDIGNMVARANALADLRPGAAASGNGHLPTAPEMPVGPATVPKMPMPDLTAPAADRLRTALKEIEDAARRAEKYRPPRAP